MKNFQTVFIVFIHFVVELSPRKEENAFVVYIVERNHSDSLSLSPSVSPSVSFQILFLSPLLTALKFTRLEFT